MALAAACGSNTTTTTGGGGSTATPTSTSTPTTANGPAKGKYSVTVNFTGTVPLSSTFDIPFDEPPSGGACAHDANPGSQYNAPVQMVSGHTVAIVISPYSGPGSSQTGEGGDVIIDGTPYRGNITLMVSATDSGSLSFTNLMVNTGTHIGDMESGTMSWTCTDG